MKKRWKQVIFLFMAVVLTAGTAGCGNSAAAVDRAADSTESEEAVVSASTTEETSEAQEMSETEEASADSSSEEQPLADSICAATVVTYYDDDVNLRVDGFCVLSEGSDSLAEALHEHNVQRKLDVESYRDSLQEDSDYSYESKAQIARCDRAVFSAREEVYVYLGQSDAETVTNGYTWDAHSGEALGLDDVITDRDTFLQIVVEKLKNHPSQEFFTEDWEKQVSDALKSDEMVGWYMEDDAINLVFHVGMPDDISETEVEIPYAECDSCLNERYANASETICHRLDDYGIYDSSLQYSFDADGDGKEELLTVDRDYETDDNHYVISVKPIISFGRDQDSLITVYGEAAEEGMGDSWLIQSEDGKYYLYTEIIEEDDYHNLLIYDVSDPDVGPVSLGENQSGAFYDFAPSDAGSLYVETRIQTMGTYEGYALCHIGEKGQLLTETEEPEYYIVNVDREAAFEAEASYRQPGRSLTLLQDRSEYVYDVSGGDGSNVTLKKGTVLYPYLCGPETYMIFQISDGQYVTFYYDDMDENSWEYKLEGIPEEELLDGILYAG